jgi:hypothetical protein
MVDLAGGARLIGAAGKDHDLIKLKVFNAVREGLAEGGSVFRELIDQGLHGGLIGLGGIAIELGAPLGGEIDQAIR